MSRTRGEGRSPAERSQSVTRTPESARAARERVRHEEQEWAARSGPVTSRRAGSESVKDQAQQLRRTAAKMRADHQPPHQRAEMWEQMAVWLECTAQQFEQGPPHPYPSVPISVAAAYEAASEQTHDETGHQTVEPECGG